MIRLSFEPSECTILVVDDEEMNRDMLCRRLERKGFQTRSAVDGFEALELIEQTDFDLVLLDVMMPKLSGLEVLHTIRKTQSPLKLPVVVATAKAETEDILQALKLGANDYITKPINFDVALARVQNVLTVKFAAADQASDGDESDEAQRNRYIVDHSVDMQSLHTPDGTFTWANAAATELLGYSQGELEQHSIPELLHPADRQAMALQDPARPTVHTLVARLQRQDGSYVWVEMVTRASVDDESGEVIEVVMSTRDLTAYVTEDGFPELKGRVAPALANAK